MLHEGYVVNLVKARRDLCLEHRLVSAGTEVVNLGDGVMGSALRAKPVTARLEIRLEDGL